MYYWLHIVVFLLSVSMRCFSSSVGVLLNLSAMLDAKNYEIAHIEALHMNLKEMQAALIIHQ